MPNSCTARLLAVALHGAAQMPVLAGALAHPVELFVVDLPLFGSQDRPDFGIEFGDHGIDGGASSLAFLLHAVFVPLEDAVYGILLGGIETEQVGEASGEEGGHVVGNRGNLPDAGAYDGAVGEVLFQSEASQIEFSIRCFQLFHWR